MKFKTNLKCAGCVDKVAPFLNATVGADKWTVDMEPAVKILTVQTTDEEKVKEALQQAGYKAEKL